MFHEHSGKPASSWRSEGGEAVCSQEQETSSEKPGETPTLGPGQLDQSLVELDSQLPPGSATTGPEGWGW